MDPQENNTHMDRSSDNSAGPIIGTIIILVVIVLGGLYFWGQRDNAAMDTDDQIENIETQSESDEVADIEADLEATDTEGLDSELDAETL